MNYYFEERQAAGDGIVYPFQSHVSTADNAGVVVGAHIHNYIEILYCTKGRFNIYLDGVLYYFEHGDMVLINSGEIHQMVALCDDGGSYTVVKFEPEVLYSTSQSVFEMQYVLPFTSKESTHQKIFTRGEISKTFIPKVINEILEENENKKYGFELAIRTHICKLFLWILRRWNEQGVELNIRGTINEDIIKRLQLVLDYVAAHYNEDITVSSMSKLCSMSYSYFSRIFKSLMGKSFSQYLNYVRVREAEKLLISSHMNITEIAMRVGFSTSSYFIYQFRMYKSVSPKRFREWEKMN